jgi:hypothetical protein
VTSVTEDLVTDVTSFRVMEVTSLPVTLDTSGVCCEDEDAAIVTEALRGPDLRGR